MVGETVVLVEVTVTVVMEVTNRSGGGNLSHSDGGQLRWM